MLFGLTATWLSSLTDAALWSIYDAYGPRMDERSRLYLTCEIEGAKTLEEWMASR